MNKIDYISGTEEAYIRDPKLITVQVSFHGEGEKSIGVLVDLNFDKNGICTSASRLEWFPKSLCSFYKVDSIDDSKFLPTYFLKAPEWLLKKKNVKYAL